MDWFGRNPHNKQIIILEEEHTKKKNDDYISIENKPSYQSEKY